MPNSGPMRYKPKGGRVDIRRAKLKTEGMSLTVKSIAAAYHVSPQAIHKAEARHGIRRPDWTDPEIVFGKLLESGIAGKLRTILSNPVARGIIRENLNP